MVKKVELFRKSRSGLNAWAVIIDGPVYSVQTTNSNGTVTLHSTTAATPKNVGRSNETTAVQQAEKEAMALVVLRKKEGWHRSKEDALRKEYNTDKPMLASDWKDMSQEKRESLLPCLAQHKLNGMRGNVRYSATDTEVLAELWSRRNNKIETMQHIVAELKDLMSVIGPIRWDGELYCHGLSLQKIVSIVKRANHTDVNLVKFHIYNVMSDAIQFQDRVKTIQRAREIAEKRQYKYLVFEQTVCLANLAEEQMFLGQAKNAGYEGIMLLSPTAPYYHSQTENDRPLCLVKDKGEMDSDEFLITGLTQDENGGATLILRADNGDRFKARMQGTNEERRALFGMDVIGKLATINYYGLSEYGIPQNPTAEAIRDYE